MILRTAKAVPEGKNPKSWWVFGEVKRISYDPMDMCKIKEGVLIDDTLTDNQGADILMGADSDLVNYNKTNTKFIHITIHHMDESIYTILTNMPTYLCNNTGETIERVV